MMHDNLKTGDYFVNPLLPYISQFANRELVSDILDKHILAEDDPKWKDFGFDEIEEYSFWCHRLCGISCIKMILDGLDIQPTSTIATLTKRAVELGAYNTYDSNGNLIDKGWYYAPLVQLAAEYGLNGRVFATITEDELCLNILNNMFTIASVNPEVIRFEADICNSKGGHLVLIIGFKFEDKKCAGFYINNPTGKEANTQEKAYIPIEQFRRAFANRGFILWK